MQSPDASSAIHLKTISQSSCVCSGTSYLLWICSNLEASSAAHFETISGNQLRLVKKAALLCFCDSEAFCMLEKVQTKQPMCFYWHNKFHQQYDGIPLEYACATRVGILSYIVGLCIAIGNVKPYLADSHAPAWCASQPDFRAMHAHSIPYNAF